MSMTFNGNIQLIGKQPLSVTENGTYNAPDGKAYDPVTVNVAGGGAAEEQLKGLIDRSITSIELPDGLTSIGDFAFHYCSKLNNVIIPTSVTSIGVQAFSRTMLVDVIIPDSVTSVDSAAFADIFALRDVTWSAGAPLIPSACFSHSTLNNITIPEGVTQISNAFEQCYSLTNISIPSSLINIASTAFKGCTNLTTITCDFAEGAVSGAPWGAPNATVVYLR